MDKIVLPNPAPADTGRIKVGACGRLPAPVPADVSDTGRVKIGACGRLPARRIDR